MKTKFFSEKPLFKRVYLLPIYLLPILIGLTRSFHIVPLFTCLFSIFLYLLTCWSDKFRIMFTMYPSKKYNFVFYKGKLCRIQKDTFEMDKSKYLIKNGKIIKLIPDTKREFGYFKNDWEKKEYVSSELLEKYPKNIFKFENPTFLKLFKQHAVSPFFVFQIFCGILWCLDEYIYQSLFTLVMLVVVEAGLVFQRMITLKQFRSMNHEIIKLDLIGKSGVGRFKDINSIDSDDILPGQIIRITKNIRLPCDMLIIKGSCAVNEAILTGESIPLVKEDISECANEKILDFEKDKKNILYAGTDIIKIDNQYIDCFVLKTGFDTVQGELIKKMVCNEEVTANDKEAFAFIGILLIFAIVAAIYTWREGVKMGKTGYKIFLECILIITNVVPTELPLEMSMAVNSCVAALRNLNVFCLEPFRIPLAGKINICCFDKTGTLTDTKLEVADIKHTNNFTIDVIRTCHSLIQLDNKITGDPLETSLNDYLNKIILKSNNVDVEGNINLSNTDFVNSVNSTIERKYITHKKYLFTSELKRMTVVYEHSKSYFVAMKGAPEVIKQYLLQVPDFFDKYKEYAEKGYRVIALAHKPYKRQSMFNRKDIEKDLFFAGFILFDCKLKEHAKETIRDLQESGHKVIMITGDNLLTALAVANKLEMRNESNECKGVEGEEIDGVIYSDEFESINVFARANPMHKEHILERYNNMGYHTLMCGDGTNDVGALKQAHIGVALVEPQIVTKPAITIQEATTPQQAFLNKLANEMNEQVSVKMGDASVAAPFTARSKSLEAILDIIRQGRSALVTSIQMYKIMALNSLMNAFSLSVLDCMGIRFGEYQLVASGILVAFAFIFLTKNIPLKEISKKRPITTIFSKYIFVSLILQVIVHISTYIVVLKKIKSVEIIEYQEKFSPSKTNTALFLLSTTQQISTFLVNYIGRPFRESLLENRKLLSCLVLLLGFIFYILFDMNIEFSQMMEVVSLGDLRSFMFLVVILDILICFGIEKLCFYLFML